MTEEKSGQADEGPVIVDHYSDFDTLYSKTKQLGRAGQYGVTFLCSKTASNMKSGVPSEIAVKIMEKKRFREHGASLYRKWIGFQKSEITALLISSHENVVSLYDVLEDEERVYLVMEYLAGGELLQWMVKRGKASEFDVANIILQVLNGLDYIHKRNIMHLDLKPENIMLVDSDGGHAPKIKLIDFGFATIVPRLKKLEGRKGTPYYMAPEMIRGPHAKYDRAVDVWATGVICFTMLVGFLPFFDDHGQNIRVIMNQILMGFIPDVRRGCGAWFPESIPISEDGRDFIAGMLKSDPTQRSTVEDCLAHTWLRGHAPKDFLPEIAMRGLEQFADALHHNRKMTLLTSDPAIMQQAMHLEATATHARARTNSMIEEYANERGLIEKDAFVRRMGSKMTSMRRLAVEELFEDVDADKDGEITVSTLERIEAFHTLMAADDRVNALFDDLDENKDGMLDPEEIQAAILKMTEEAQVAQLVHVRSIFASTDANGDGFIDREEFLNAIHPNFVAPKYTRDTLSVMRSKQIEQADLRQRSLLYFELLRQAESHEENHLVVPVNLRRITPKIDEDEDEMTHLDKTRSQIRIAKVHDKLRGEEEKKKNEAETQSNEPVLTIDFSKANGESQSATEVAENENGRVSESGGARGGGGDADNPKYSVVPSASRSNQETPKNSSELATIDYAAGDGNTQRPNNNNASGDCCVFL